MAPHTVPVTRDWHARQDASTLPSCVITCMAGGDTAGCASATDLACLCSSSAYANSVLSCWTQSCTTTEMAIGQNYSANSCADFVSPPADASGGNLTVPEPSASVADGIFASSTPSFGSRPEIYQKAFVNVQAIMSSICAALLLAALVMGLLACRNRIKRDREIAQRTTWAGVGTAAYGGDTKDAKSRRGFSRGASSSAFANCGNNFDVTSLNFGGSTTISHPPFGGFVASANRGNPDDDSPGERISVNRGTGMGMGNGIESGFTNRLSPDEVAEEWELAVKRGPDSLEKDLESPSTSTT